MHALSRRIAMRLLAGVAAMPSLVAAAPIADPADWLNAGIRSGVLRDVHAVLISRGGHVVVLGLAASYNFYPRANSVPIALGSLEFDLQPMVIAGTRIHPDLGRRADRAHDYV